MQRFIVPLAEGLLYRKSFHSPSNLLRSAFLGISSTPRRFSLSQPNRQSQTFLNESAPSAGTAVTRSLTEILHGTSVDLKNVSKGEARAACSLFRVLSQDQKRSFLTDTILARRLVAVACHVQNWDVAAEILVATSSRLGQSTDERAPLVADIHLSQVVVIHCESHPIGPILSLIQRVLDSGVLFPAKSAGRIIAMCNTRNRAQEAFELFDRFMAPFLKDASIRRRHARPMKVESKVFRSLFHMAFRENDPLRVEEVIEIARLQDVHIEASTWFSHEIRKIIQTNCHKAEWQTIIRLVPNGPDPLPLPSNASGSHHRPSPSPSPKSSPIASKPTTPSQERLPPASVPLHRATTSTSTSTHPKPETPTSQPELENSQVEETTPTGNSAAARGGYLAVIGQYVGKQDLEGALLVFKEMRGEYRMQKYYASQTQQQDSPPQDQQPRKQKLQLCSSLGPPPPSPTSPIPSRQPRPVITASQLRDVIRKIVPAFVKHNRMDEALEFYREHAELLRECDDSGRSAEKQVLSTIILGYARTGLTQQALAVCETSAATRCRLLVHTAVELVSILESRKDSDQGGVVTHNQAFKAILECTREIPNSAKYLSELILAWIEKKDFVTPLKFISFFVKDEISEFPEHESIVQLIFSLPKTERGHFLLQDLWDSLSQKGNLLKNPAVLNAFLWAWATVQKWSAVEHTIQIMKQETISPSLPESLRVISSLFSSKRASFAQSHAPSDLSPDNQLFIFPDYFTIQPPERLDIDRTLTAFLDFYLDFHSPPDPQFMSSLVDFLTRPPYDLDLFEICQNIIQSKSLGVSSIDSCCWTLPKSVSAHMTSKWEDPELYFGKLFSDQSRLFDVIHSEISSNQNLLPNFFVVDTSSILRLVEEPQNSLLIDTLLHLNISTLQNPHAYSITIFTWPCWDELRKMVRDKIGMRLALRANRAMVRMLRSLGKTHCAEGTTRRHGLVLMKPSDMVDALKFSDLIGPMAFDGLSPEDLSVVQVARSIHTGFSLPKGTLRVVSEDKKLLQAAQSVGIETVSLDPLLQ